MNANAPGSREREAPPAPGDAERFRPELLRYLRWLGADAHLAADIAQDTIVQCWRTPPCARDAATIRAWLRTVARNRYRSATTRAREGVPLDDTAMLEAAWQRFCERDADGALGAALRDCLEQLPPRTRRAIELHYRHGLGHRELSSALRLTQAGTKALLRRARGALADCIERRSKP